jgi:hypothetical protein
MTDSPEISEGLRRELLLYLTATSAERARIIAELVDTNPGMGEILMDLEGDDDLRARFETELLRSGSEPTENPPSPS